MIQLRVKPPLPLPHPGIGLAVAVSGAIGRRPCHNSASVLEGGSASFGFSTARFEPLGGCAVEWGSRRGGFHAWF